MLCLQSLKYWTFSWIRIFPTSTSAHHKVKQTLNGSGFRSLLPYTTTGVCVHFCKVACFNINPILSELVAFNEWEWRSHKLHDFFLVTCHTESVNQVSAWIQSPNGLKDFMGIWDAYIVIWDAYMDLFYISAQLVLIKSQTAVQFKYS